MNHRATGIRAALGSAVFLGLAPIFGKQAILLGLPWLAVVAARTTLAALLLLVIMLIFKRQYLYIYPAGLLGVLLAGGINGAGSLLYYGSLDRIDAGLGQLLYSLYPLFVALFLRLDHQPLSRLTVTRLLMIIPALYLLTRANHQEIDLVGMLMMIGSAMLYALHLPINQRVLYDMPAPTVTLYTLIAMSLVTGSSYLVARLVMGQSLLLPGYPPEAWRAVLALTLVTFFSRLTLFLGVKHLGGLQTAILGLSELVVAVLCAQLLLGERFSLLQWSGMLLLVLSLLMVGMEKTPPRRVYTGSWLNWLRPPLPPGDIPWRN